MSIKRVYGGNNLTCRKIWLKENWGLWTLKLRVTTGRFESGLCPTRNRPNQVGWTFSWPTANWLEGRVELVDSLLEGGWVSVRCNLAENSANSAKIWQIWLKPGRVFNEILSDLARSNWWIPQTVEIEGLLVIESVGSVEIGFRFKDPPTDPPKLSSGLQEPPPTRHSFGSGDFQIKSVGMGGWVWSTADLDSPT